ncbi:MAG: 3-oxoacyl-[acyl-carrier-protein] reductase [Deltaproteobacteria bacterium RIFCSPLOWO2_12_FULL_43_16]|nr:MAG: 3-oxoacyl-[acyl-carrier-protein] reductase [Deltaproteobacteria bacterium GWA2_43_19]OGQ11401.1 MAG: 3-oxoacyl-[acyl-carrier-protein] reductase [Deltaproteobacteria bacterium RIFCSPHIGHO2_02_FULL_43_33]OGQ37173.1 MAG: 3-oxoacyl-[acyl-carrier-protein] reductase [Deltaproteobacteria bacterium RIFCSPLOWO2_01_FULL_42_9]OGQ60413.1 MAG: 3-oxoacyl-[acyl-carrier-protein] reductase [Deltaproteobacteria bacterium RIFCSPLOWO2_12_FULL_43_16]HBR17664.1 3-oxoacyl-ACP reductase [Deltaproteobacteria ba
MILKGKVALVTGAAQGIGKSIALKLATNGADLVISDVNLDKAQETAKEVEKLGRKAIALKANVANLQETETMIDEAVAKLDAIHILVNNAGITKDALILRMKEEDWDAVIGVNLKGVFNCTKAAVKYMAKQRYGRIVNIASIVGEMGNAGQANYAASKAGVFGLTKTVAREFASRNVTCNAIAPGFIETAMTQALSEKVREELANQIPMGRLGTPDDVAEGVLFLVSEAANYITGQVININGGMYM